VDHPFPFKVQVDKLNRFPFLFFVNLSTFVAFVHPSSVLIATGLFLVLTFRHSCQEPFLERPLMSHPSFFPPCLFLGVVVVLPGQFPLFLQPLLVHVTFCLPRRVLSSLLTISTAAFIWVILLSSPFS